jgi:hypothetical protein
MANKPSALFFNQTALAILDDQFVNSKPITGMDNQIFNFPQGGRVVYHAVARLKTFPRGIIIPLHGVEVWLTVEILNASNTVVSMSSAETDVSQGFEKTIQTTGIGILPAGTFHTRVLINRSSGGEDFAAILGSSGATDQPNQGSQLIVEIFPD